MKLAYFLANQNDLPEIMDLTHGVVEHMEARGIHQWNPWYPAEEDYLLDIEQGTLIVGKHEQAIVAMASLDQNAEDAYANGTWKNPTYAVLHRLCVACDLQSQGIGSTMLSYLESKLKERDIHAIHLDVYSQNPGSVRFYESNGYLKTGSFERPNGTFWLMEKEF